MGQRKNKKEGHRLPPSKQIDKDDDYNLEKSFSKLRSYTRKANHSRAVTEPWSETDEQSLLSNSSQGSNNDPTDSDSWSKYTHLDDKISSFQTQNENAHIQLRKDLNGRIDSQVAELRHDLDSKLPIKWYSWTIGAIVAIVSLIYVLSYQRVLSKQDKHSTEIQKVIIEIKDVGNSVNGLEERFDKIEKSLNEKKPTNKGK